MIVEYLHFVDITRINKPKQVELKLSFEFKNTFSCLFRQTVTNEFQ